MSEPHPELLILIVTFAALALAPLASRLVARVGNAISQELDGGRTGDELDDHLDSSYEGRIRDDEIAQMMEARAYLRRARGEAADAEEAPAVAPPPPPPALADPDDLREEVRQIVVAANERRARKGEPPLDVEPEVDRRLARLRGSDG